MPPSGSFWDLRTQKWPKVFPLAKIDTSFFWAEIFSVVTRTQSGCVFLLSLKNTVSIRKEKQNTEDLVKNLVFSMVQIFLKTVKFYRNDVSREKKTHPNLGEVFIKKFWARSVQPFWRKKGGKLVFFCVQKSDFEKTAKQRKFFLIFILHC